MSAHIDHRRAKHAQSVGVRPAGTLFLIGGALDEDPALIEPFAELLREAGGDSDRPRLAILTTASEPPSSAADLATDAESDEADGAYYERVFGRHGIEGVPIPVGVSPEPAFAGATYSRAQAERADLATLVASCDGVFLGGGDQSHYLLALFRCSDVEPAGAARGPRRETPVMTAIRELFESGGVVAGTSAGLAIQQGAGMVTGGTSELGWLRGASAGYEPDDELRFSAEGGFGFFTEGLLDSHFTEWNRVPRAIRLGAATGEQLVIGVDEHTALVYRPGDRVGEVVGSAGVNIIDLAELETDGTQASPGVLGARWSHLTAGDRVDFATRTITRATHERVGAGEAAAPAAASALWSDDGGPRLLALAQAMLASSSDVASGDTAEADAPGFRLTLARDARTTRTEARGFSQLRVSITPKPHHG